MAALMDRLAKYATSPAAGGSDPRVMEELNAINAFKRFKEAISDVRTYHALGAGRCGGNGGDAGAAHAGNVQRSCSCASSRMMLVRALHEACAHQPMSHADTEHVSLRTRQKVLCFHPSPPNANEPPHMRARVHVHAHPHAWTWAHTRPRCAWAVSPHTHRC